MRQLALSWLLLASLPAQQSWTLAHTMPRRDVEMHLCAHRADRKLVCLSLRPPDSAFETWEWDGTVWHQRFPAQSPPWTFAPALAYDATRRVIVMFTSLSTTWEWNGLDWTQRQPPTSPPARNYGGMAYDAQRQRIVLFGGSNGSVPRSDLWEWDGITWVQRTPTAGWPPACRPMLAYDEARSVLVMCPHDLTLPTLEVWEYDGTLWSHPNPPMKPQGLNGARVAYDSHRNRTVFYGGYLGFLPTSQNTDLLEWDGAQWHVVTATVRPPFESGIGFAYDENARRLVVQGSGRICDTWTYDGQGNAWMRMRQVAPQSAWGATAIYGTSRALVKDFGETFLWDRATQEFERLQVSTPPPAMTHVGMVFDVIRRQAVLLGITSAGMQTWLWSEATMQWQQAAVASPPAAVGGMLAYDITRDRTVLFGGILNWPTAQQYVNDVWEWDGASWTQIAPPTSPPPRAYGAMAYDPGTGGLVLFGGMDAAFLPLGDVWDWNGASWSLRLITTPGPTACSEPALVTRPGGVRLIGGYAGGPLDEVWSLQGSAWTLEPSGAMPPMTRVVATGDAVHDEAVAFFSGVWMWGVPPATSSPFGGGCGAGGSPRLVTIGQPVLGTTPVLQASGLAAWQLGFLALGLTTQIVELPASCRFLVAPEVSLLAPTDGSGVASVPLVLPSALAFVGLVLYAQGAALDPGTGYALTPALRLRLGS